MRKARNTYPSACNPEVTTEYHSVCHFNCPHWLYLTMFCSERQGTLDNVVTTQPRTPPFTSAGLLNYIVELVVNEDDVCIYLSLRNRGLIFLKAFQLVDKGTFRRLLTYLRPSLMDKDIPHRTKIRTEIIECAKAVEERVKAKLQV